MPAILSAGAWPDVQDGDPRPARTPGDSSAPDGGSNHTSSDGGPSVLDGSLEAGPLDCAGFTFCDSFERTDARGAWPDESILNGAKLSITSEAPRSGTGALRIGISDKQSSEGMLIYRTTAPAYVELRYSFRVHYAIKQTNFFGLTFKANGTEHAFFIVLNEGSIRYADQVFENGAHKSYFESDPIPLPVDRWIDVVASYDAAKHAFSGRVDDVPLFDGRDIGDVPTADPMIFAGVAYTAAGPGYQLDVDDVRIKVQ